MKTGKTAVSWARLRVREHFWFFMPASAGSSLSSETEAWSCCCYPKDVAFLNMVEVDGDRQISHIQSSILLNTWTFPTDISFLESCLGCSLLTLPVSTPRIHYTSVVWAGEKAQILALGLNSYPAFSHYWCELGKFYLFWEAVSVEVNITILGSDCKPRFATFQLCELEPVLLCPFLM